MMTMNPGAISTATLRVQDLLENFASALPLDDKHDKLKFEAYELAEQVEELHEYDGDVMEGAYEVLDELREALEDLAPEGYYFGGHPGDGAEFGFYPLDWME